MTLAIVICSITCVAMILSILFFPRIRIGKIGVATYWVITLMGACILLACGGAAGMSAVFATIIGSNLGALFTPIGALAGIMWSNILNKHEVKFRYIDFLKIGVVVAIPTLAAALGSLALMLMLIA